MNIMMIAAGRGMGVNPGLSPHEGILFSAFLALAGLMLLTAAALLVRRGAPRHAARYARPRFESEGL